MARVMPADLQLHQVSDEEHSKHPENKHSAFYLSMHMDNLIWSPNNVGVTFAKNCISSKLEEGSCFASVRPESQEKANMHR